MHTQHIRRDYRFIWYRFIDQRLRSFNVSFDNNLRLVIVRDANILPLSIAYSSIFTQTHTHIVCRFLNGFLPFPLTLFFHLIFFLYFFFVLLRLYYLFIFRLLSSSQHSRDFAFRLTSQCIIFWCLLYFT